MKKNVDAFDYAGVICKALRKGVLLTTRVGDRVNTMTIGWGKIGVEWGKPIFIAYVRDSRYTKQLLEESGEFTVNVPMNEENREILGYCGSKSGRDTDKIRDRKLETVDSDVVAAPGIVQFPLTLECKVIYRQKQDENAINEENTKKYYPRETPEQDGDYHTAYYGQITAAYVIE